MLGPRNGSAAASMVAGAGRIAAARITASLPAVGILPAVPRPVLPVAGGPVARSCLLTAAPWSIRCPAGNRSTSRHDRPRGSRPARWCRQVAGVLPVASPRPPASHVDPCNTKSPAGRTGAGSRRGGILPPGCVGLAAGCISRVGSASARIRCGQDRASSRPLLASGGLVAGVLRVHGAGLVRNPSSGSRPSLSWPATARSARNPSRPVAGCPLSALRCRRHSCR